MRALLRGRLIALAVVGSLLVAGCESSQDPEVGPTAAPDGDGTPAAEPEATGPTGSLRLSGFVEEHPRAVALALLGIEVDPAGHILIDLEAVNRGHLGRSATSIAEFGVRVTDDAGNRYAFRAPADNGTLRFGADERLSGTLAFEGPIDPDARYLEVAFNQSSGESVSAAEDGISQFPRFLFEQVPLPGIGLEDEAARGPSNDLMAEQVVEVGQTADLGRDDLQVTLVRYVVSSGVITFELEAANTGTETVDLARGVVRVLDGQDTTFRRVNESDDRDERVLRLGPGEELTAQMAFRGDIAAGAESLTLYTNANARDCASCTNTPYIEFTDIPLPE